MKDCLYPDWEQGLEKGEHKFDKDGYCIICGTYKENKNMETLPILFEDIPTKTDMDKAIDAWIATPELTPLQKKLLVKKYEYVIDTANKKLGDTPTEDFLNTFNGAKSMDILGVKIQVKDMSKSATLKDPSYEFSSEVLGMEEDVKTCEETLKFLKDKLKLQKTHEINTNIAKKLDAEVFPEVPKSNLQLSISLRK